MYHSLYDGYIQAYLKGVDSEVTGSTGDRETGKLSESGPRQKKMFRRRPLKAPPAETPEPKLRTEPRELLIVQHHHSGPVKVSISDPIDMTLVDVPMVVESH